MMEIIRGGDNMELTIQNGKKTTSLSINQLCLYQQSKIIEAISSNGDIYYLFFHKDTYIDSGKAQEIQLDSHLHHAFSRGVCLPADHPFINELIVNKTFPVIRLNQLDKKLSQQYAPTEAGLILSYFDQFLPEETTFKRLQHVYYDLRRNGKMLKAYKTLHILANHRENNIFCRDMLAHLDFQRFEEKFQNLSELKEIDRTTYEFTCFNTPAHIDQLLEIYQEENRVLDEWIIRIDQLKHQFNANHWQVINKALTKYSKEDQIACLTNMINTNPDLLKEHEVMDRLLTIAKPDTFVQLIMEHAIQLDQIDQTVLLNQLNNATPDLLAKYFNHENDQLLQLTKTSSIQETEAIITPFVTAFLATKSITDLISWLKPFHLHHKQFSFDHKLQDIKRLEDDPEQQYKLGELYLSFDQYDRAIDCFKWEVELNPSNLSAIQTLIQLLKKTHNATEANAYQALFIQTEKYQ